MVHASCDRGAKAWHRYRERSERAGAGEEAGRTLAILDREESQR